MRKSDLENFRTIFIGESVMEVIHWSASLQQKKEAYQFWLKYAEELNIELKVKKGWYRGIKN